MQKLSHLLSSRGFRVSSCSTTCLQPQNNLYKVLSIWASWIEDWGGNSCKYSAEFCQLQFLLLNYFQFALTWFLELQHHSWVLSAAWTQKGGVVSSRGRQLMVADIFLSFNLSVSHPFPCSSLGALLSNAVSCGTVLRAAWKKRCKPTIISRKENCTTTSWILLKML